MLESWRAEGKTLHGFNCVRLCHTSARLLPVDLWVLRRQGSGCGQRPGFPKPRDWTAPPKKRNHQPLRQRNRPSYYKLNHAHYGAILILSGSKDLRSFDWSTSLFLCVSPLLILFLNFRWGQPLIYFVQITTCSGGCSGEPQCKAVRRISALGFKTVMVVPGCPHCLQLYALRKF